MTPGFDGRPAPGDVFHGRSKNDRTRAAARVLLAHLEQDLPIALKLVGAEAEREDPMDRALFINELSLLAGALVGQTGQTPERTAALLRAAYLGATPEEALARSRGAGMAGKPRGRKPQDRLPKRR